MIKINDEIGTIDSFYNKPNVRSFFESFLFTCGNDIHKFNLLTEAGKYAITMDVLETVTKFLKSKIEHIDMEFIDKTMGDITKFTYYDSIKDVISTLSIKIKDATNNDVEGSVELNTFMSTVNYVFNALHTYKKEFMLGYLTGKELIIYLYESIVVELVIILSYFITNMVKYTFEKGQLYMFFDVKHLKTDPTFQYQLGLLTKFHNMCMSGKIVNFFQGNEIKSSDKKVKEESQYVVEDIVGAMLVGALSLVSVFILIWFIREIIYMFYYIRGSFSNYFDSLSVFLQINSLNQKDPKIKEKQKNLSEKFRKISDKISLETKAALKKSTKDSNRENSVVKIHSTFNVDSKDVVF